MAGLRSLLEYSATGGAPTNGTMTVLNVYNTNTNDVNNGGLCCEWTIPAGVSWVGVEVWGGGGAGAGGCCNHAGRPGSAGTYARKILAVTPGDSWTVCAGGTTCCLASCCGCQGFGSYICKLNTACVCASAGCGGCTLCLGHCNRGNVSINTCAQGCAIGHSMAICGIQGFAKWTYGGKCNFHSWAPGAPYAHTSGLWSGTGCANRCGHTNAGGCTPFPGSGGMSANNSSCGTTFCGAKGAGGMVQLTFISADSA